MCHISKHKCHAHIVQSLWAFVALFPSLQGISESMWPSESMWAFELMWASGSIALIQKLFLFDSVHGCSSCNVLV